MRKIIFALAFLPLVLFTACSSSEDDNIDAFTLSQKNVELLYGGESEITVNGVSADDCLLTSSDDFIADAKSYKGKILINGNHVGKANISVSCKGRKVELPVIVKPIANYIGMPVVEFGADLSTIKKNETSAISATFDGRIDYVDHSLPYSVYHRYFFNDGKLANVLSEIDIPNVTKEYCTFFVQVTKSLRERYTYLDAYKGQYQTIYLFTFKNKYYIGARDAGGNGGWYVYYAKTLDEVKEKLDIHPSIAI